MRKIVFTLVSLLCFAFADVQTKYAILIKGGHLIDPKNNIDGVMDVAVSDGKIVLVAKNITAQAVQVVDAKGMYVVPGLIDLFGHLSSSPDIYTFRTGITTIADAGTIDWKTFAAFKKNIIDRSETRVLALLNIEGAGYKGGAYEKNTGDEDAKQSADLAKANPKDIAGFKVNFTGAGWAPVDRGVEAGNLAGLPIMLDGGRSHPMPPLDELLLKHMRPGDIYTHTYTVLEDSTARGTVVDFQAKKFYPYVLEAQKKGIIFDVGHGSAFRFSQAIPAMKAGFYPNTISTDALASNMNAFMKDMPNVMSKFMAMGMSLPAVIKASTWSPAQAIKRDDLGHLSQGAIADIAIFSMRTGKFGFFETAGYKIEGTKKLECEMTIKGGRIVYDLNGIAKPLNNFYRNGSPFR